VNKSRIVDNTNRPAQPEPGEDPAVEKTPVREGQKRPDGTVERTSEGQKRPDGTVERTSAERASKRTRD